MQRSGIRLPPVPPPILSFPRSFLNATQNKRDTIYVSPKPHLSTITLPVLPHTVSFWFFAYPFIFMANVSPLSSTAQSLRCSWLYQDLQSKHQTNAVSQLNFQLLFWGNHLIELSSRETCRAPSERGPRTTPLWMLLRWEVRPTRHSQTPHTGHTTPRYQIKHSLFGIDWNEL